MGGGKVYGRGDALFMGLQEPAGAKAPLIARFQACEAVFGAWRGKIVAAGARELEELGCSLDVEGGPGIYESGPFGEASGRPIPVAELTSRPDDIGICFRMNGNELTPDHGAPVRMAVPGWGGTSWIKWLTEIRIDSHQHWCRLNTRGEVYIGPDYKAPEVTPTDEFIGGVTAAHSSSCSSVSPSNRSMRRATPSTRSWGRPTPIR